MLSKTSPWLGLLSITLWMTAVAGCGSKNDGIITDWFVVVGSMRGVTGAGSGYRIHGDGRVESWTSVTEDREFDVEKIGVADDHHLTALYAAMQDPALREAPGSMGSFATDFLEWHGPDATWRCIWDPTADAAPSVKSAYETAMALVHDVER